MPTLGYVFPIGGGCGYACESCKARDEANRATIEANGCTVPEFYGPTILDGDAVCEGCNRFIRDIPGGRA